jgi:hypothetical protein
MKMGKMSWTMMIGCGLMLVGVLLLPALGVKIGGVLPYLLVLACPLSHLLMMKFMGKGHDHSGHGTDEEPEHDHSRHVAAVASPVALPAPRERT